MYPWKKIKPSVAILVPHQDIFYFPFVNSLIRLNPPPNSYYTFQRGLTIDEARENVTEIATGVENYDPLYVETIKSIDQGIEKSLDYGVDYIFFLDSDVIAPPNAIQILMQAYYPFVSGIYYKRVNKPHLNLYMKKGNEFKPVESVKGGRYFFADGVGLGISLIESWVFKKLSKPWFLWEHYRVNKNRLSEDLYFCNKVYEELGIKPLVDLFVRARHVGMGEVNENGIIDFPEQ